MSNEDKATKWRTFFIGNLGFILVTLTVLIYLFYGLVTLDQSGKSAERIILDSAVAWIVGFSIARMLEYQGFLIGDKNESVQRTKDLHGTVTEAVSKDIEYLDEWCNEQNELALKVGRSSILSEVGLKYSTFFRENATIIDEALDIPKSGIKVIENRNKKKRNAIQRAINCKITPLSTNSLTTSFASKKYDPYNFGMTKAEYTARSTVSAILQKIFLGIAFGYYSVTLIDDFAWGYLIYTGVQVSIFLLLGGITMVKAYFFVIEAQREATIKKINNL
ncbi:MAG: hypothetical protein EOM29_10680, partial [Bacteroidia bacterium]|nr:hypothetical protein [Bacteroidia bacterium]